MSKPPENQQPGTSALQSPSTADLDDLKTAKKRQEYLDGVDFITGHARDRVMNKYTSGDQKLAWARVLIQGISAGVAVLRDTDLELLAKRIAELEEAVRK